MDRFLASVERRAYCIANMAVGNREDALDLVQETMIKLVDQYLHKPEPDWPALFHTILQSKIRDFYRRERVRKRWRVWLDRFGIGDEQDPHETPDPLSQAPDPNLQEPQVEIDNRRGMELLNSALQCLPPRQQQAFLLRAWEGLSTDETARAMGISSGSVKTHYARARAVLQQELQDYKS
ncbi:MAG: RNA polymerase sigma factor [Gammaproteobacteria bacterium]|nr:RNA polymerase sigma factor [Gammaproteobacteria bacterium]